MARNDERKIAPKESFHFLVEVISTRYRLTLVMIYPKVVLPVEMRTCRFRD